jgi:hypothetical protein
MEKEEKELSPSESLALIQSMISNTKGEVANDSFHFLFWGWLVFGCCILEFFLKTVVHTPYHYAVWWLTPVGGVVSGIYGARQSRKIRVKTFVDESLKYLWLAVAWSFIVLMFINFLGIGQRWETAFSYYILLYAIGTFVTGGLLRFKPLLIGGSINFALAIIASRFSFDYQLLIAALAILCSYIIPGHLLRIRHKLQKR